MSQKRTCALIYNPQAGKLRWAGYERLERAQCILNSAGHETLLAPTSGPGTAADLTRNYVAQGVGMIVAAGGDGTINEVVEGMVGSDVTLGILPAGTANVLASETGMSTDLEKAARALCSYTPERISIGRIQFSDGVPGSRHFLLMAGIGLDARVIYNLSVPVKKSLGKLAYWITSFTMMGRHLEEFTVAIDDRTYRCSFALVSKVRNYGGDLTIARDTCLFDNEFEVVLFEGENSLRYIPYFMGVVFNRLRGMKGITILRATELSFRPHHETHVYMQVDGEYAGHLPGSIEIVRNALTLLLPPGYRQGLEVRQAS